MIHVVCRDPGRIPCLGKPGNAFISPLPTVPFPPNYRLSLIIMIALLVGTCTFIAVLVLHTHHVRLILVRCLCQEALSGAPVPL